MPKNLIVDGALVLYGPVGGSWWDEDGFTATDVLHTLAGVEGDLDVRINSGGGIAWDGIAIFNALNAYDGKVTIKVDGIAASAASIIAMAGDEIVMGIGSLMMIHNASGITFGTADDHAKSIEVLRKLDGQMAGVYAKRTGMDRAEVATLMTEETWMTGAEAVEKGFATSTEDEDGAEASAASVFDYRLYAHAPESLRAAARPLHLTNPRPAAAAAQQEVDMTEKTQAAPEKTAADITPPKQTVTQPVYSAQTATEVMELCAIAGVDLAMATQMVKAQTPIDQVRADLAARAADAANEVSLDASRKPPASGSGWDEVVAEVNRRNGVGKK